MSIVSHRIFYHPPKSQLGKKKNPQTIISYFIILSSRYFRAGPSEGVRIILIWYGRPTPTTGIGMPSISHHTAISLTP